jgi:hypothetical protein
VRVDTRPRKRNAPRIAEKSAPGFLQWIRGRKCLVAIVAPVGRVANCDGKIEAAHVDYAGGKGVSTKVADKFAIPLCRYHHAVQHASGWQTFETKFLGGVGKAFLYAETLWRSWPGRIAWERKLSDGA